MENCDNCGRLYSGEYCANCHVDTDKYSRDFPNVTWEEVRDHLSKRLLLDDEAIVLGEDEYFWWPAFLCQHVYKEGEGHFSDESPDNWMQIVAETEVGRMNEELGVALADEVNSEFVHGSAIYIEGVLKLRTSFAFNPLNRAMLKIFHEQILAQATLAHEFALRWVDIDGIEFCYSNHPVTGPRDNPDDLLGVFWGDTYSGGDILPDFSNALEEARALIPELMEKEGWAPGFSNDEVDFFLRGNTSIGIGVRANDPENAKYGPGIFVYANDMDYQMPLGPQDTNTLNVLASTLGRASQFGSFLSKNYIGELGPRVTAFIPYGPLAEDRFNPLNMAMTITNFAAHVSKCCMGTFGFVEEAKNA